MGGTVLIGYECGRWYCGTSYDDTDGNFAMFIGTGLEDMYSTAYSIP